MNGDCTHPECQDYVSCQRYPDSLPSIAPVAKIGRTFEVKAWLREHRVPDAGPPAPAGAQPQQEDSDVIEKIPESTHQDDALDTLVSRASIPNLGALIKQGIKQGLIAPTATYR